MDAVLLLGSNLGDRECHLRRGVEALERFVAVAAVSRIYESEPFGPVPQPWFLNVAVRVETALPPLELLAAAKGIERGEGRAEGGERWGPRPLDIDIILLGALVIRDPALVVPHERMAERRFCLAPVAEIAPDFPVPPGGETVRQLLERCTDSLEVLPR